MGDTFSNINDATIVNRSVEDDSVHARVLREVASWAEAAEHDYVSDNARIVKALRTYVEHDRSRWLPRSDEVAAVFDDLEAILRGEE